MVRDFLALSDWLCYCKDGRIPPAAAKLMNEGGFAAEVVKLLHFMGALRPIGTIWPAGPVTYFEHEISVDPAPSATDPMEKKILEICAPLDRAIWIQLLRVTAANATAEDSGEVSFKNNKIVDFPEMCLPTHPQETRGVFNNIENFGLVPEAGFRIMALNYDTASIARFHILMRAWAME
jgi:hypothetical protein